MGWILQGRRNPFLIEVSFLQKGYLEPDETDLSQSLLNRGLFPTWVESKSDTAELRVAIPS